MFACMKMIDTIINFISEYSWFLEITQNQIEYPYSHTKWVLTQKIIEWIWSTNKDWCISNNISKMSTIGSQRSKYSTSPQNSCTINRVSPKDTSNDNIVRESCKNLAMPQNSFTSNGVSPKSASNESTTCDSRTPLSSVNHQARSNFLWNYIFKSM